MKGFWSDGISLDDLEKVLLCFLYLVTILTILYMWVSKSIESALINELSFSIGGYLIIRKGMKYFKKSSNETSSTETTLTSSDNTEESTEQK